MRNVLTFVEEAGIKLKEAIMNAAICMASIRFLVIVSTMGSDFDSSPTCYGLSVTSSERCCRTSIDHRLIVVSK